MRPSSAPLCAVAECLSEREKEKESFYRARDTPSWAFLSYNVSLS